MNDIAQKIFVIFFEQRRIGIRHVFMRFSNNDVCFDKIQQFFIVNILLDLLKIHAEGIIDALLVYPEKCNRIILILQFWKF